MKRIILLALCLMCIAGTASAYQLYLKCPSDKETTDKVNEIQAGLPIKCSIDSNFPAGTTFDVVFYQSGYTATQISKQQVTIQSTHNTQYKMIDTQGLPGGTYKIELQFINADAGRISSDSIISQLVQVIDRSGEIEITSPTSQKLEEALRIEGSIAKEGSDGVQLKVSGPDGVVLPSQYIATTNDIKNGAGKFTRKVPVSSPGTYEVEFSDAKGFIGTKTFIVNAPATEAPTVIPTTTEVVKTMKPVTTVPTPWPTSTPQSPLSPIIIICATGLAGLLAVLMRRQ
jgi:hypothetical protein